MTRLGILEVLIIMLIIAALVALFMLLAFFVIRLFQSGRATISPRPTAEPPLETLRRRLAAGEITPEQYDDLRRRLEE